MAQDNFGNSPTYDGEADFGVELDEYEENNIHVWRLH